MILYKFWFLVCIHVSVVTFTGWGVFIILPIKPKGDTSEWSRKGKPLYLAGKCVYQNWIKINEDWIV